MDERDEYHSLRSVDAQRAREQLDDLAPQHDQMSQLLRLAIDISSDLRLDATLQRVVHTAVAMTAAPFGAIRVWGHDGLLASFIHAGVDQRAARLIGDVPVGHVPAVGAFLSVPIVIRGEVFGSLDHADGSGEHRFGEADEITARALASVASVAVDNARLFDQTRAAARWAEASREITAALLSDGDPQLRPMRVIAHRAQELTDSEQAIVLVPADPEVPTAGVDSLIVSAAVGPHADKVLGQRVPVAGSTTGAAFRSREAVITDSFRHPIAAFTDVGERPAIVVPMCADQQTLGVLIVARNVSAPRFTDAVLDLMRDFASHAAIAVTISRARGSVIDLAMLADRERIAHDLHDQVIQRVFAVGMDLQGVIARVKSPELTDRLGRSIDELQAVITDIRTTIFQLAQPLGTPGGFEQRLREVFAHMTEDRELAATLAISGQMGLVSAFVGDHAEAVVVEAVSNAVRHSGAHAINVEVTVGDGLRIEVCDNGCGLAPNGRRRSGLANLARRAEAVGGELTIDSPSAGGVCLTWSAPLQEV